MTPLLSIVDMVIVCWPGASGVVGLYVQLPCASAFTLVVITSLECMVISTVLLGTALPSNNGCASVKVSLFVGLTITGVAFRF